jgi:hypothetical protein
MSDQINSNPTNGNQIISDNTRYLIDIFVPNHSRGLMVDAIVLQQALGTDKVRILTIPYQAYLDPLSKNDNNLLFEKNADIIVFVERLFEHSKLQLYSKRVFLSNPEWLTDRDKHLANTLITDFWHKTRFGMNLLIKVFPQIKHFYIGFTSLHTPSAAKDYDCFSHFPGKSKTRHTQDIIDIWIKDSSLPTLKLQAYGGDIKIPKWIILNNLNLFLGFLDEKNLQEDFIKNGIHICTSQMEGFGHYINEARSIGALIIILDAPPMNELIDSNCGIVIPVKQHFHHHHGVRFIATSEAIKEGVLQALKMPIQTRIKLGEKARDRFIKEQKDFSSRLKSAVLPELNSLANTNSHNSIETIQDQRRLIFSTIYAKGIWGKSKDPSKPFYSGSGSHDASIVSTYIQSVQNFLKTFGQKPNAVDLGCGDFSVGSQIRSLCNHYIACDIVPELIDYNKKLFHQFDVDFRFLDLVSNDYPNSEIVFIRQVLQHLSNSEIKKIIPKLKENFKYLVLTEHLPFISNFPHNIDKPTGPNIRLEFGSGVVLTSAPFNLIAKEEKVLCEVNEYGGIIRTILYVL